MLPRLITDENVPASITEWLRAKGYDVRRTVEVVHRGAADATIIRYSQREGRIIVTLDHDFIRLYRQLGKPFGAIVIKAHPPTPSRIKELLTHLFSKVDVEKHSDELTIVTYREIRIETH